MRTPEELVRAGFAAVDGRDLDALRGFWDDDTLGVMHALDLTMRGPVEISAFFTELFAALPDLTMEAVAVHPAGERTAVGEWRMRGTFCGGPFRGLEPTGRSIDLRGVDVQHFDGETLRHYDVYYDSLTFVRQVGMLPPADSRADRAMITASNVRTRLGRRLRRR